jgi:hypothetical protein
MEKKRVIFRIEPVINKKLTFLAVEQARFFNDLIFDRYPRSSQKVQEKREA